MFDFFKNNIHLYKILISFLLIIIFLYIFLFVFCCLRRTHNHMHIFFSIYNCMSLSDSIYFIIKQVFNVFDLIGYRKHVRWVKIRCVRDWAFHYHGVSCVLLHQRGLCICTCSDVQVSEGFERVRLKIW